MRLRASGGVLLKAGMIGKLKEWQKVLLCLLVVKAGYFALLVSALWLWRDFDESRSSSIREGWFPATEARWLEWQQAGFARHFTTWDAAHYLVLSEAGYFKGLKACVFYPLWPLLIRLLSDGTGVSKLIGGMVLANLFSLAGWTLFWCIAGRRFGEAVATWALVFLVVFPGSLFYQFVYTEPLFFLLTMLLWFGLESKRYGLAWVAAFLLPLSRAVGVLVLLPILWHVLMHGRWGVLSRSRWLSEERTREKDEMAVDVAKVPGAGPAILITAPFLGWATYFCLMRVWTGNAYEGFEAQVYWRAHSIGNLWDLPRFFFGFFEPTSWHEFRGSVLDRCGFLMLAFCLPLLWRLGKDLTLWSCVLGIVPTMSGTFISFIRFESVIFPLFIALGVVVTRWERPWLRAAVVLGMGVLHLALLWRFVNYGWAG